MSSNQNQEQEKSMLKLAQFSLFYNSSKVTQKCMQSILEGMDLNLQIPDTFFLQKHNSDMIGSTLLHLAYSIWSNVDIDTVDNLIRLGLDFTIKNKKGNTVLHELFDYYCIIFSVSRDMNTVINKPEIVADKAPFIESILSAHVKYKNINNPSDSHGITHFHIACATNHFESIQYFLSNRVSVNQVVVKARHRLFEGFTPLHFAAQFGYFRVVERLLQYGANANLVDAKGRTPLGVLLERNLIMIDSANYVYSLPNILINEQIINHLLNYTVNTELSQLCIFSSLHNSYQAEKLLAQEINVNESISRESKCWPGYTALHFAAHVNVETFKLLIWHGANIEAKNTEGLTPFDMCIERYKVEDICDILFLVPNVILSDGQTKLIDLVFALKNLDEISNFLQKSDKNINLFVPLDSNLWPGFTLLHIAVLLSERKKWKLDYRSENEHLELDPDLTIITECLKQGADVTVKDHRSWTPVHMAFYLKKTKTLNLLLKYHHRSRNIMDDNNLSHLHIACTIGDCSFVERLLWNDTDVNIAYQGDLCVPDTIGSLVHPGWTPLHIAVYKYNSEITKLLLKFGGNAQAVDKCGFTPIHGLKDVSKKLSKIFFNVPNFHDVIVKDLNLSYLHVACYNYNVDAAKRLLDLGVDVNRVIVCNEEDQSNCPYIYSSKLCNGWTPLHFVMGLIEPIKIDNRRLELVQLLTERGGDLLIKDSYETCVLSKILKEGNNDFLNVAVTALKRSENMQQRMQSETGITMLHIACRKVDLDLIKELLDGGADINSKIPENSSIWPGFTPLHALICSFGNFVERRFEHCDEFNQIVKILLDHRADVTLSNAKQRTPLHMAYYKLQSENDCRCLAQVSLMLKAHRNFEINPTSIEGISHFHIACHVLDVDVVENFLEHDVDVNSRIDMFYNTDIAACTPLLLATQKSIWRHTDSAKTLIEPFAQLKIVDLLIKYGARVNVEDISGSTPAHYAAIQITPKANYLKRLADNGADVNARNARGETPLEVLVKKTDVTLEEIQYFIGCGCYLNAFNPFTEEGYIAQIAAKLSHEDIKCLIFGTYMNFPDLLKRDVMKRTGIHNLVCISNSKTNEIEYAELFDILMGFGYDIDEQDNFGRTALHLAALFRNESAIAGLLLVGADINVTDKNGKTSFAHVLEPCSKCNTTERDRDQYGHMELFRVFVTHINKLQICNLDVCKLNEQLLPIVFDIFEHEDVVDDDENFLSQIKHMSVLKIKPYSLFVMDFLSESTAIIDYCVMSQDKRKSINAFFAANRNKFQKEHKEVASLIQLQYRKAVLRQKIINKAKDSLSMLMKFRLPDLCSHIILRMLKNFDLQNLIVAASQDDITNMDVDS